jgi:ribosomal-protein-alanine N-acetyltransferase
MGEVTAPIRPEARKMSARDVERVVQIEREAFTSPWKAETFLKLLERPGAELWVLEHPEDGVVGYAVLWCILDQGELANIAVTSEHRGRGLGAFLLGRVMEVARDRGVASLYLEVRVGNADAIRLYRSFSFEELGVRRAYYEAPREDALVMVVRL